MSVAQPGNRLWIAVFAYFLIAGGTARAQPEQKPPTAPEKATDIKNLLKERLELRKTIVEVLVAQAKMGVVNWQSVFDAQRDVSRAALDLADSPEARIAVLKGQLKLAEEVAKITQDNFTRGTISKVETIRAKAAVVDARIELLQEESKAKTGNRNK